MSPDQPPTIAHLRTSRVAGLIVTCNNAICMHAQRFAFAELALADDIVFVEIVRHRRFICTRCAGRAVHITPDWSKQQTKPRTFEPGRGYL
jgi:hypothetical protein